jgi:PST family polysaccharide transporter
VRELDRSLVHGIAWTSGAKWASQLLSWASTLIVARLLTPGDFGLVGMASVFLGLVTMLSEFGLGSAIVALRDLSDEQMAQLNTLSVAMGVASFALSCAAAVPLGHFFAAPELPAVVVVTGAGFIVTAFRIVPSAMLQRDLKFKALAAVEAGRAAVMAIVMVAFAAVGLRYWTLVIGGLLSGAMGTAAVLVLQRHRFARPRQRELGHAVAFSKDVLISRLAWYTYSNADFLVAGRVLGKTALGLYDLGWTLSNIPIEKITALVSQVTPPIFSAVQHDSPALRRYLLRVTEGLALITYPLCIGMALVAPEFVRFTLGAKWEGAILPLQLLAVSAAFRAVTPLLSQILLALKKSRIVMKYAVVCAIALPAAFYLSARVAGPAGIAFAWVVVFPILVLGAYRRCLEAIALPERAYLGALWPGVSSSLIMAGAVVAIRGALPDELRVGWRFGIEVIVGAAAFALTCVWLHRPRIVAFYDFARALRRSDPQPS